MRNRGGFTLLETIVALAVIMSALAGPLTLATQGIFDARFAKNKLTGANLSQEGLEIIRQFRENNILANRAWDFGLSSGDARVDVLSGGLFPYADTPLLLEASSSLYNYSSGNPTLFKRKITITKPAADQMIVTSFVEWVDAGMTRSITLQETMYNWK